MIPARPPLQALCCIYLLITCAASSAAHDFWIDHCSDVATLYQGHQFSDHTGVDTLDYRPEIIRQALQFSTENTCQRLAVDPGYPARFPVGDGMLYLVISSGCWTKTPYGTENKSRSQVPSAIRSWLSVESIGFYSQWHNTFKHQSLPVLALTPQSDLFALVRGDKLTVLATLAGEPIANAVVSYDGNPRGVTDASGQINIRLRRSGRQHIQAAVTVPISIAVDRVGPAPRALSQVEALFAVDSLRDVDEIVLSATLQFEVPDEH